MIRGQRVNHRNLLSETMGLFKSLLGRNKDATASLEQVLKKLASDDSPKLREKFYRTLLDAKLLLATPGATAEDVPVSCPITNQEEDGIGFIATNGPDGKSAMIVFSGRAGFEAWQAAGCECVEMPSSEIFKLAIDNHINSIVINPHGPFSGFITQGELRALAEGAIPQPYKSGMAAQQIKQNNKMMIGRPMLPPRKSLVSEVKKQSEAHPEITAAYIVEGVIGNGEPHTVIALQMTAGASVNQVVTPIAESIQKILFEGEYVDFYPIFPHDELINQLPQYGPPVYQAPN